jgi:hypothetical protein
MAPNKTITIIIPIPDTVICVNVLFVLAFISENTNKNKGPTKIPVAQTFKA